MNSFLTKSGFLLLIITYFSACNFYHSYSPGYPLTADGEEILCHTHYCFVYDSIHKQSKWIYYELRSEMLHGDASRSSRFFVDTLVISGTATDTDFIGSGYDRGHLLPAGDMVFCENAMRETFYYSNVSPQEPSFNRGIWKRLENTVRNYAVSLNQIYVVTGPVLKDELPAIGDNNVSVPEEFYKAILVYNDSITQGIAFLMPNKRGEKNSVYCYSITISELNEITGITFFPEVSRKHKTITTETIDTLFWKTYENSPSQE